MLKKISNLGAFLSKQQQQNIQGGDAFCRGGCVGKNAGDLCYGFLGGCRTVPSGVCGNSGGVLICFIF